MTEKKCPECGAFLFINCWEGWIWECVICDKQFEPASDKEIEEMEKEFSND